MKILKKGNYLFYFRENTADEDQLKLDLNMFFLPEYFLKSDDIIIDIGAHIGTFTIPIADKVSDGYVYSIEPCKESFEYLMKNISLNGLKNISAHNIALTNFKGTTKLYYNPKGNWGDTITKKFSDEGEIINTNTLENFLIENNIKYCDFIKVNCEGAEFEIFLNSSKEVLSKIKLILISYHCDLNKEYNQKKLIKHLIRCGFKTSVRNMSKDRGWIIARNINTYNHFSLISKNIILKRMIDNKLERIIPKYIILKRMIANKLRK